MNRPDHFKHVRQGALKAPKRIGIAADHGGYELKEYLAGKLRETGHEVVDFGDGRPKEDDDYPDFIVPLARAVAAGTVNRGVGICAAFHARRELPNLLLDSSLSRKLIEHQEDLRSVVSRASESGVPIPGLMVSLGYLDAYRSAWLPANLIQAQRDYFGAHTYERSDAKGAFHTEWEKE
jgi:hypothetical protein